MASQETWDLVKRHFSPEEFKCKCGCGRENMDDGFVLKLYEARVLADILFGITSGCRCWKYNKQTLGSDLSSHPEGVASDIRADDSRIRFNILCALLAVGFNRIGIGPDFIHVDDDPAKPPDVVWVY